MDWYVESIDSVLKNLGTSNNGLDEKEVQKRFAKFGKNILKKDKRKSKLRLFFEQLNSFLIYILIAAALISGLIGHFIDAVVIGLIVILNSVIGFFQEYKSEEIIEKLRKSLRYRVLVLRNGVQKEIDSNLLVPGDIVVFESGDKVLADCRIISSENLQSNESVLTGESFPVGKSAETLKKNIVLAERKNMLYAGTTIVRGRTTAVVVNTGGKTEIGKLADMVQKTEDEIMPLEKKINTFSKNISIAILAVVIFAFFVGIYNGVDIIEMFMTSISLAVGAIPEGLPAIIAIGLAVAIKQMYKVNTLIRRLPAAETLGRATVICTDKTGTLTEEELTVDEIYVNKKYDVGKLKNDVVVGQIFKIGLLCNNARDEHDNFLGDPTEVALIKGANKFGFNKKKLAEENIRVKEFTFDSDRKMMSIVRMNGKIKTSYVKGAPLYVLKRCTRELVDGKIKLINDKRKKELIKVSCGMESRGLRVLGFGFRQLTHINQIEAENHLTFAGFIGMIDPPRKEVRSSIKDAIDAGIKIKIITGDSALTTKAIAKKIGLDGEAIEGKDLEKLSEGEWHDIVKTKTIFSRVTPQQKLKIVDILKMENETVAVTGDGVNDILALKRADIGISMGVRGSDVARDSSDMVLLDDNFASIIRAVEQGRRVFENIKKSIKFLFSVNVANVFIIITSLIIKYPLPFLPLAILWMNLITDSLPALALSVEPPHEKLMKKRPENKSLLSGIWIDILFAGLINFLTVMIIFSLMNINYGLDIARTSAVTVSIFQAILVSFSFRSERSVFRKNIFENKWLVYAGIFSLCLHLLAIYTFVGAPFGYVSLNWIQIMWTVGFAFIGFLILEFAKGVVFFLNYSK